MRMYVVEMVRRSDSCGSHHYIIGVYDDLERAEYAGAAEMSRRGYKYECRIVNCTLNEPTK